MDAHEIKTAVAHQEAARAAAEAPFVNLSDPARLLGPDGRPAVSRRAPIYEDVPDDAVERLALAALAPRQRPRGGRADPEPHGRRARGPVGAGQVPGRHHARTSSRSSTPTTPTTPSAARSSRSAREHEAFTAMMEDSLAEDRHSPVPGLVHRYPDRVLMLVTTQCASYCRYCTRSRIVGDPTQNFNSRDHEAQLEYLRRTPQVRDVLISGGDGLTLAPKLFEKILRGLREIPHIEIIRIGSRVPVFLPQRIDDELCEVLEKYHPLWINLHFNHPNEITPEVSRAVDKLTKAGLPVGNQSVLLAGRQRLRPHPALARPQARREPDPAVLPVPVRPGRRVRALPDTGRQGPRDHGGAARPHVGLRGADLRDRCARRRRQDPGHAQLPHLVLRPQGRAAQLRGLHHDLRGARELPQARLGARARTASTSARSPASPASLGLLEGERMWIEPKGFEEVHTRGNTEAHRLQDPSKWVPFGVGALEGQAGAPLRVIEAGEVAEAGPHRAADAGAGVRPGRGAPPARGRADRGGPRGAALAAPSGVPRRRSRGAALAPSERRSGVGRSIGHDRADGHQPSIMA